MDRIAGPGQAVAHDQVRHGAPDIARLVVNDVLNRLAPGRRVPHQTADKTQASGVVPLPEPKAKMRASRTRHARLQELARCGEGDRIFRIDEHAKVKPDTSHDLGRIGAEFAKKLRHPRQEPQHAVARPTRPYVSRRVAGARMDRGNAVPSKSNINFAATVVKSQANCEIGCSDYRR